MDLDNLKRHEVLELAVLAMRLDPKVGADEYIALVERFQAAVREDEAILANQRLRTGDTE